MMRVSFLVRHRRALAGTAVLLVILLGALVREPVFQGSLVSEMSPDLPELVAAQRIRDARAGRETSVIMIRPAADASIRETLDALEQIHAALLDIEDSDVRSILPTRHLLFAYGLDDDALSALMTG